MLSTSEFKERLEKIHGKKYTLIGEYFGNKVKLVFTCSECKKNFTLIPNKILSGRGCQYCSKKRQYEVKKLTRKQFEGYLSKTTGSEYELLEFTSREEKAKFRHNCGNEYFAKPSKFMQGNRCPSCAIEEMRKKKTMSNSDFLKKIKKLKIDQYLKPLVPYVNTRTRMDFKCLKCDNVFSAFPNNITSNLTGCPLCKSVMPSSSNMVLYIENILKTLDANFKREVRFSECRRIRPLPFDFQIGNVLLEFDGEQHSKGFGKGRSAKSKSLRETLVRDEIKNNFCMDNNIPLVRIDYTINKEILIDIIGKILTFNDQSKDVLYEAIGETGGVSLI